MQSLIKLLQDTFQDKKTLKRHLKSDVLDGPTTFDDDLSDIIGSSGTSQFKIFGLLLLTHFESPDFSSSISFSRCILAVNF